MPHRRPPALRDNATPTARANFRQRYDEVEAQRAALIARFASSAKMRTSTRATRARSNYSIAHSADRNWGSGGCWTLPRG